MDYEDKHYYLAFSYFQKIGPIAMKKLDAAFPYIYEVFFASAAKLERAGLKPALVREFVLWRDSPAASIDKMIAELKKERISFITWHDPEYPGLLKEISAPPFLLYYKGRLDNAKNNLAVVGSRKFSAYGEKAINELLPLAIEAEINIISGLALGIDALAHQKALNLKGKTWAILGSGLDDKNIYPPDNRRLAQAIIDKGGALISEFPPGAPPLKQNFPQRNRIIAGLAQATLVVEAREKSGALITADYALDSNRDVLAVPGNIFSESSAGPNKLIKQGAKTIAEATDILEAYGLTPRPDGRSDKRKHKKEGSSPSSFSLDNETEALVYKILEEAAERAEKISVDEIVRRTELDTSVINSTLSILELRGIAKNSESGYDVN